MKSTRLGCLSPTALLAALLTLLVIFGVWVARGGAMFSPGALNAQSNGVTLGGATSHADLATDCAACHAPFWGESMTDRCLTCHTGLTDESTDFHLIMLAQSAMQPCQDCHTDHHGAHASLTSQELADFPHDTLGFSLARHLQTANGATFACADCHPGTFSVPDQATCVNCHAAYQAEFMLAHQQAFPADCLECHDGHDRFSDFDHALTPFALQGQHASAACQACHQNVQALADLQGLDPACRQCHAEVDPHAGQFSQDCAACHSAEAWTPSVYDHASSGFELLGKHQTTACNDCHNQFTSSGERLYAGLPAECAFCHTKDEPHEGRFGMRCETCHTPEGWRPAEFNHNLARFPLVGLHRQVECAECHTLTKPDGSTLYAGTPMECAMCHREDDAHGGSLGTGCADCHTPEGWSPSTFDHARSIFPLTGAHINASCQGCHNQVDSAGHRQYTGTPTTCAACHQGDDAHNGQFGSDCQSCHSTAAWKPATFDHSRTAFQLTGAHVNASCQGCHSGGFSGTPTSCAACHGDDDAHNGQFGSDCQSCHSTSGWKPATFDHSRSSFPLTGAHTGVSCQGCHSGGFSGTPSACVACHGEPAVHAGAFGTSCDSCHSTSAWLPASFNGAHSFPMNHGDANDCQDCHPSTYTQWTCYGCHDQGEVNNEHQDEGIGDFSDCMRCHADGREGEDDD